MEFKEKIKIGISKEEKGKELSEKEREIVNDIYLLLSERKISPEKLSSPLKDLIIWEKPLKIEKKYYERNNYLNLPGELHINVRIGSLDKPSWINIRIRKQREELFDISLTGKKAEEIISLIGTLGMVEEKDHCFVLKKTVFQHINEKHGKMFKKKFRIETEKKQIEYILASIKNAQYIKKSGPDRRIYYYQSREGGPWIKTIVNLRTGLIISSYPE